MHKVCRHFFRQLQRKGQALLLVVLNFLFCAPYTHAEVDNAERELKIKIAYLYHFSQFTQWEMPLSTLNYCIFNDIAISEQVKATFINNNSLSNLKLAVHAVSELDNLDLCQIIFFPHTVSKDILSTINQKPILSVGVQKDFTQLGGIIYLFEEDQKIRFFINNARAQEANLKLNSQLLALSRVPPL